MTSDVERIGGSSNAVVVQLRERQFPGIVLQGDSLKNMARLADVARAALRKGDSMDAQDALDELASLIQGYLSAYADTINKTGRKLPW